MALDIEAIRRQFPFLSRNPGYAYLDCAATAQKPGVVIEAMHRAYEEAVGNPHRGLHASGETATTRYEDARKAVRAFVHAAHDDEIVFTRNATESINLVARAWGEAHLTRGDRVILSVAEHHSNIVPWLRLKHEKGIELAWIDIDDEGRIRGEEFERALAKGARMVALTAQSNVLGTRFPLKEMIAKAHAAGALTLVDAAQFAAHGEIDVRDLDCDFLAFSAHKTYGPTGIGALCGKRAILERTPPFLGGGMMIRTVDHNDFSPADAPQKFEAGTMPVAEAIGFATALGWLSSFPAKGKEAHERALLARADAGLRSMKGVRILGPANLDERHGCIAFTIEGAHPHDLADMLAARNIAIRAGNHCAQPLHDRLGIVASARISVGLHNTIEEIDRCLAALEEAARIFRS